MTTAPGAWLATQDLWPAWSLEPGVLLGLAVSAATYGLGLRRLWRARPGAPAGWRAVAFAAGLATVALALASPLDALSRVRFAAHMAQHMLLIMVAAPLLVLGAPGLPIMVALPPAWRRRLGRLRRHPAMAAGRRLLLRPMVAWALHVGALWAWHLPAPYQAALASDVVHAAEHASFLGTAGLFWWVVLSRDGRRGLAPGFAVLYLFAAALQGSALGALLTLAPAPLYPLQAAESASWGLPPLADQQLAGLIMWVPADLVYLGAAGAVFLRWLASLERASPRDAPAQPSLPVAPGGRWRSAPRSVVADRADQEGGA